MSFLERRIQQRLSALDPNLFLDKEWTDYGMMYGVKYRMGDTEPFRVLAWRGPDRKPLPLSLDIVFTVAKQEGDIHEAVAQTALNNSLKKQKIAQERMDQITELAKEHNKETGKLRRWFIPGTKKID